MIELSWQETGSPEKGNHKFTARAGGFESCVYYFGVMYEWEVAFANGGAALLYDASRDPETSKAQCAAALESIVEAARSLVEKRS